MACTGLTVMLNDNLAVVMVQETKDIFENLVGSSFDRGFYSPENKSQLAEILDKVVLPNKGRIAVKDKEIEQSEEIARPQYRPV
jgi:hypothetical protein